MIGELRAAVKPKIMVSRRTIKEDDVQLNYRDGIKSFQKLLCLFFSFLTFLDSCHSSPLTNYGTQAVPSLSRLPWKKVGLSMSCLDNLQLLQ